MSPFAILDGSNEAAVAAEIPSAAAEQMYADRSVAGRAHLARQIGDAMAVPFLERLQHGSPEWAKWCEHADIADSIHVRSRLLAVTAPDPDAASRRAVLRMLRREVERVEEEGERAEEEGAEALQVQRDELLNTAEALLAIIERLDDK